jgi:hypothetical protein
MTDPYLDAGVRGHIVRVSRENVHRLAGYDMDDLIQEGYLCYTIVHKRYVGRRPTKKPDGTYHRSLPPRRPDDVARRHFMRLLQRTFNNRIATLARKQSAFKERLLNDLIERPELEERAWDQLLPPEEEVASVTGLLRAAPMEIKQLFALMVDEVTRPYRRFGKRRHAKRETNNQYYSRLLGLPRTLDVSALVENYFLAH